MSIIQKQLEKAMAKGQQSIGEHIKTLTEQNDEIIENLNEMIDLMEQVCKKLDIKTKVE